VLRPRDVRLGAGAPATSGEFPGLRGSV